jgi:nucleoredoxin
MGAAEIVDKDNNIISNASLEGNIVGLYFSASWCGPCCSFTPQLAARYAELRAAGHPLEIIFISSDRSPEAFTQYYSKMPWLALKYEDRAKKAGNSLPIYPILLTLSFFTNSALFCYG